LVHQINVLGVVSMLLHKGVPKDNFYVSSCDFHYNLLTHHFLTPLGHRAFL
jgi:hypothetical protein